MNKKQIRAEFRRAVFERDKYRCLCCGQPGKDRQGGDGWKKFHKEEFTLVELDAHHINDRHLMPGGGYVKENGISVCPECHLKAEEHWVTGTGIEGFSPDDLYKLIGSSLDLATATSKLLESVT
jgi:5-methylcytosine-specific restriction endonuclease McrA